MDYDKKVDEAVTVATVFGLPVKDWLIKAAKSKTIWFSTAVTLVGAAEALLPMANDLLGQHTHGIVLTVVGLVGAVLRFSTKQAIADK